MDESWRRARAVAGRQRWLLTARQAREAGLAMSQVATRVRAREWLPVLQGVYLLDADMYASLPEEIWWQAALLAHGDRSCLVGRTAARAHCAEGLPPYDHEIDVAIVEGVPRCTRQLELPGRPLDGPTVVVHQWPVHEHEVVVVDGFRLRRADLTMVDAALLLDRVHALCIFDSALRKGLMTSDELMATVAAAKGRPGVVATRFAASVADGRAQSPLESRIRLACIDGDLAPDELQYVVRDRWESIVAIGDLAWLRRRARPLIAEADGAAVHSAVRALFRDRRRSNDLVVESHDVVRFTWQDALNPTYVQQIVRAALAA